LASPLLPFFAGGDLQQEKRKRRQLILIHFCPDCSCIFFLSRFVNFCLLSSSQFAILSFFSRWQLLRLGGGGAGFGLFIWPLLLEAEIWSR
jgi:hypothetical protein